MASVCTFLAACSVKIFSLVFYSVDFFAAVLNKYSFAFYYLKCTFRVMSCCMDFTLKCSGVVNWLNPCLTLHIKLAVNFIAVYLTYF